MRIVATLYLAVLRGCVGMRTALAAAMLLLVAGLAGCGAAPPPEGWRFTNDETVPPPP